MPKNQHTQRELLNFEFWINDKLSKSVKIWLSKSIFKSLYFLKWCPIFDTSPLTQFSKFNNSLWVCWFLGKNLSNFVPPVWKIHNPYCHTDYFSSGTIGSSLRSQKNIKLQCVSVTKFHFYTIFIKRLIVF